MRDGIAEGDPVATHNRFPFFTPAYVQYLTYIV